MTGWAALGQPSHQWTLLWNPGTALAWTLPRPAPLPHCPRETRAQTLCSDQVHNCGGMQNRLLHVKSLLPFSPILLTSVNLPFLSTLPLLLFSSLYSSFNPPSFSALLRCFISFFSLTFFPFPSSLPGHFLPKTSLSLFPSPFLLLRISFSLFLLQSSFPPSPPSLLLMHSSVLTTEVIFLWHFGSGYLVLRMLVHGRNILSLASYSSHYYSL